MFFNLGIPELLILFVAGAGSLFWIWMIIEAVTREPAGSQDRLLWTIVVVFTHFVGALIYFFVRRPVRRAAYGV